MGGHSIVMGPDLRLRFVERSFVGFPTNFQYTVLTSRAETSAGNIQPSSVCFFHSASPVDGPSPVLLLGSYAHSC